MPRNVLRPRKPRTGAVELVPLVPGRGRPVPPHGLSTHECRIWNDVVDALPDGWLDLAGQLILRRLVMQCAIAERREQRLRRLLEDPSSSASEDIDALAPAHAETAKHIAYMLTHLRATPRSRLVSRAAGFDFNSASVDRAKRPWEVRARDLPQ
jgi:hypothetical protein